MLRLAVVRYTDAAVAVIISHQPRHTLLTLF